MVDQQAPAELGAGMDLDPGQPPTDLRENAGAEHPAAAPESMGDAMEDDRMHAGVAEQDLELGARRRIAVGYRLDVVGKSLEHNGVPQLGIAIRTGFTLKETRPISACAVLIPPSTVAWDRFSKSNISGRGFGSTTWRASQSRFVRRNLGAGPGCAWRCWPA